MTRFRRMKTLQKFSSVHASVHNHFAQERHLVSREVAETLRRPGGVAVSHGLAAGWVWTNSVMPETTLV